MSHSPSESEISVTPIPLEETGSEPFSLDLGDPEATERINALLNTMRDRIKSQGIDQAYILKWHGSKVPHGAEIAGQEVTWTQHGLVYSTNHEEIGVYQRTVESGGQDGTDQEMVVFPFLPKFLRQAPPDEYFS